MSEKICIVSTIKASPMQVVGFVNYHINLGVDKMFLFFDSLKDPAVRALKNNSRVVCFSNSSSKPGSIETRQRENADRVLAIARKEKFDWIVHMDVDELIYVRGDLKRFLGKIAKGVDFIRLPTLEAVPERLNYGEIFKEITLFRNNFGKLSKNFFRGHIAGKAIVRVNSRVNSLGIHRPIQESPRLKSRIILYQARILHFNRCSFETWRDSWIPKLNGMHLNHEGGIRYQRMIEEFSRVYNLRDDKKLKELYKRTFFIAPRKVKLLEMMRILIRIRLNPKLFEKEFRD